MTGSKDSSKISVPAGLPKNIPRHIAVIMDGNGRWAKARSLPRIVGHRAGVENLRRVIEGCVEFGIRYLTIYAFSTENWVRPEDEVKGLMTILEEVIDKELTELHRNGVQLRHIGRLEGLNPLLQKKVEQAMALTRDNRKLTLNIAFNYGGRDELVLAMQKIIHDGIPEKDVDEALIESHLYTADVPDPDLIIRTSGEQRGSNFLIWQSAYSEWYFPATLWPDFDKEELRKALWEFSSRNRRFGGLQANNMKD
jgi:undecaprenyl diphosphate synthase